MKFKELKEDMTIYCREEKDAAALIKPEMTAVEVLEWLRNPRRNEVVELFGSGFMDNIFNSFSPREIVDKITAYEAAKKAHKPRTAVWSETVVIYRGSARCYTEEYDTSDGSLDEDHVEEVLLRYVDGMPNEEAVKYYATMESSCRIKIGEVE